MPTSKPANSAQLLDQFMQRTALAVFLLALSYGIDALASILGERAMAYLRYPTLALHLAVVLLLLPVFWRFRKLRGQHQSGCATPESFVVEMFRRAAMFAFSSSFVLLIALDFVIRKQLFSLSPAQLINLLLWFMLTGFSMAFYLFSRGDDSEAEDEVNRDMTDQEPRT